MNFFSRHKRHNVYEDTIRGHSILIRYLEAADVKPLHRYINALSQERTFVTFQAEEISQKAERQHVRDVLQAIKAKREVKLLLFVDGVCCGSSEVILESRVTAHRGNLGLSIAQHVRGMGLGKLFLTCVLDEAQKSLPSLRLIQLTCFATNIVALSLYKKLGFVECGRVPRAIYYNGDYIDEIIMVKQVI